MSNVVHRWQPIGYTPCGREIAKVRTNIGYHLSDGATCKVCRRARMRWSILRDDWNGQSDGVPRAGAEAQT